MTRTMYLLLIASLLFSCRARQESTTRSAEAGSESKFSGRVVVFDIYDKATNSTRQAPGIMVARRGALISDLKPGETVILSDDKRKGEKYFPLNIGDAKLAFVGLETPPPAALALAPAPTNSLPPLSAQEYAPLSSKSRLEGGTNVQVIMYNDDGYVLGKATTRNGIMQIVFVGQPRAYPSGGYLAAFFSFFLGEEIIPQVSLSDADANRMLSKGGAIIRADDYPKFKYDGIIYSQDRWTGEWKFVLRSPEQPGTVDIIAYARADPSLLEKPNYAPYYIRRKDMLPETIRVSIDRSAVKFNLPPDSELEIKQYLDCWSKR